MDNFRFLERERKSATENSTGNAVVKQGKLQALKYHVYQQARRAKAYSAFFVEG